MQKIFVLIFLPLILSGCEDSYSIDDFKNSPEIHQEYLKKCRNGEIRSDSLNCQNAFQLESIQGNESDVSNFKSLTE